MTFQEYQELTAKTAKYTGEKSRYIDGLVYCGLGLAGEAGEVANKIKKILRDNDGLLTYETRTKILDEIGDCMWYISQLTTELGSSLEEVTQGNITKLLGRLERGTIKGSGDNR